MGEGGAQLGREPLGRVEGLPAGINAFVGLPVVFSDTWTVVWTQVLSEHCVLDSS
jgi:hypothetical protein